MTDEKSINWLVGKTIRKIFMNEENLKFETDQGDITFSVYADCCSQSVFYDFYGVKNIIGKEVTEVKEVQLTVDERMDAKKYQECVQVYGYQIFWKDDYYGDRTAVFSFRNYSNGYYGGSLEVCENKDVGLEITDDVVET